MSKLVRVTNLVLIVALVVALGVILFLPARECSFSGRTFTDVQLRAFITGQAECHAEYFYTHDPQITGADIDDAVDACFPTSDRKGES